MQQQFSTCHTLSSHMFTREVSDSEGEVDFTFSEDTHETTPSSQSPAHSHIAHRRGRSGVVNCSPAHSLPLTSPRHVPPEAPRSDSTDRSSRRGRSGVVNCPPSPAPASCRADRPTASTRVRSGVVNCSGAEITANLPGTTVHTRHVSLAHSNLTTAAVQRSSDHRPKISLPPLSNPAFLQVPSNTQPEVTGGDGGMVSGETEDLSDAEEHLGGCRHVEGPVSSQLTLPGKWMVCAVFCQRWLITLTGPVSHEAAPDTSSAVIFMPHYTRTSFGWEVVWLVS